MKPPEILTAWYFQWWYYSWIAILWVFWSLCTANHVGTQGKRKYEHVKWVIYYSPYCCQPTRTDFTNRNRSRRGSQILIQIEVQVSGQVNQTAIVTVFFKLTYFTSAGRKHFFSKTKLTQIASKRRCLILRYLECLEYESHVIWNICSQSTSHQE